jgi:hypothetical protein
MKTICFILNAFLILAAVTCQHPLLKAEENRNIRLSTVTDIKEYLVKTLDAGQINQLPDWAQRIYKDIANNPKLYGIHGEWNATWDDTFGKNSTHSGARATYDAELREPLKRFILSDEIDEWAQDIADKANIKVLRKEGMIADAAALEQVVIARQRAKEARLAENRRQMSLDNLELSFQELNQRQRVIEKK